MTKAVLSAMIRPLVEPRLPGWVDPLWFATKDEALEMAPEAEIGWFDLNEKQPMIEIATAATRLRWLNSIYAGLDFMPLDLLRQRGTVVTNGAGINAITIAEYTVMLMLAHAKGYRDVVRAQERHEWLFDSPGKRELAGERVLLFGLGAIGKLVKTRLEAFDMTVVPVRRSGGEGALKPGEWREKLGEFEWLVLAVPSTAETRHMIGAIELAQMRPDAVLVNIARGDVIDQDALVEALQAKKIEAALLDVTDPEPLPEDHPLWDLDNAQVTMHLSGRAQTRMFQRSADRFIANLERWQRGEPVGAAARPRTRLLTAAQTADRRAQHREHSGREFQGGTQGRAAARGKSRMNDTSKASDLFVECLEAEGCEYIFGVPGEENLDFLDSLSRSAQIKLVLTRHEQGAGFMAATYGRHTGKTGVCIATLGPGATNFVTAAAYAQLGGMPMMMITGQKPIKKSKQGQFQILDVVAMMDPITKYTRQLHAGDNIPSRVREAYRLAEEEKPGAVHLELPEDIAEESTSARPIARSVARRPSAEPKAVRQAVEAIEKAKKPILVIGAGANRKMTGRMLNQFVEKTGIPFVTTQMGKGVLDERHPLFLGCAALSAGDFCHRAIEEADCIVNIGHDVIEKPPFFMKPEGVCVVHVSNRSAEVDPVYFPQIEVIGDIANAIWQIKEDIVRQGHWSSGELKRYHRAELEHTGKLADDARFPIFPPHLVRQVRDCLPEDGIICLDNGVYKIWFARGFCAYLPNTVLLDNALATMGAGLPSAMMSAMLYPERQVMAICGDGGFMMNSQEMETAVRLGLDLTVLILRDDAYGMIRWKQANMGFDDFGLTYGNPDFVKYAESYGASGHRVESSDHLREVLAHCRDTPGVHLIDCPVDYSENDRILNKDIKELSKRL